MISFAVSPSSAGPPPTDLARLLRGSPLMTELSDHLRFDLEGALAGNPKPGFIAVAAVHSADMSISLVGYAQVSSAHDADLMELALPAGGASLDGLDVDLFHTTVDAHSASNGDRALRWWTDRDDDAVVEVARSRGFVLERRLWLMELDLERLANSVPLTTGKTKTRAFDPVSDPSRLLTANNRAFADHGEQGGWTDSELRQRLEQPWFSADGLRILDIDGVIAGFCWTKPHGAALGEIYIIGVDPDFAGHGYGTVLVSEGLSAIAATGARRAMLWVDDANTRAVQMYERLGFEVVGSRSAFLQDDQT